MVAFNFKQDMAPKIIAGIKRSTIRSKKRCDIGDPMQLYRGMRTKSCEKICADQKCIGLAKIYFSDEPHGFWHMPKALQEGIIFPNKQDLHDQEGFDEVEEMADFFEKTYGLPYEGWLHVWG